MEVLLPINAAIPCGLIVNELISNALKHAFPDEPRRRDQHSSRARKPTSVCCSRSATTASAFPTTSTSPQTTTLGLQLVTLLVDQLGGELEIHRANPTRFSVRFPLQRP